MTNSCYFQPNTRTASSANFILRASVLAIVVTITPPVFSQTAQDTVRWDERAAQWVYTLFNPADASKSKEIRYTPRTLIEPLVKSSIRLDKDAFEYRYRISNGGDARQPIGSISVRAPKWDAEAIKHAPLPLGMSGPEIVAIARAETAAEQAFVSKSLASPNRWKAFLNVNRPTRVVFGWLANENNTFQGIEPSKAQGGFSVLRAELPGAAWAELQGNTPDIYNAPTLPSRGALAEHVAQVLQDDAVYVPVMVPAIVVPSPYDGTELARRIKAHVSTWVDSGLMDAERLTAMVPQFDLLIASMGANDKKSARAAVVSIMVEAFKPHPNMTYENTDDDGEANDSSADKRKVLNALGALVDVAAPPSALHRVAARALIFDLRYLLVRMSSASTQG